LAHHKSTKKRIKTNEKSRVYNRAIRSRVKTYIRNYMETLEKAEKAENRAELKDSTQAILKDVVSELQKATNKGVLHKNTISRKVGRLTKAFNKVFA